MNREIYATDGEYTLCPIAEEDKEIYCELCKQVSENPQWYFDHISKKSLWSTVLYMSDKNYSIFDRDGDYCGNVSLQRPESAEPEIGVDLLEEKRNKGIAARAIKMLAQKACEENGYESFTIRALEKNTHSRHMIEKLGAVLVKKENPYRRMIDKLKKSAEEDELEAVKTHLMETADDLEKCTEIAYVYRYMPDMFA